MILSQIFYFFPLPPALPPCLLLFLSTPFQRCSVNESQLLLGLALTAARTRILIHPAKLRQNLTRGTRLWGSHLPSHRRALSYTCKLNFLRFLFSYKAEAIFWRYAHGGTAAAAPGNGTKPPHPPFIPTGHERAARA